MPNRAKRVKKVEAPVGSSGIVDEDTNEEIDWGEVFFMLHKHCGLNKWEIFEYTLPQVTELIKKAQKNIRFEIEASVTPIKAIASAFGVEFKDESTTTEETDLTDGDLDLLNELGKVT